MPRARAMLASLEAALFSVGVDDHLDTQGREGRADGDSDVKSLGLPRSKAL